MDLDVLSDASRTRVVSVDQDAWEEGNYDQDQSGGSGVESEEFEKADVVLVDQSEAEDVDSACPPLRMLIIRASLGPRCREACRAPQGRSVRAPRPCRSGPSASQ